MICKLQLLTYSSANNIAEIMAPIFISYSRADAQFISDLVPLLHEAYGIASVFYDEQIPGGTKWWEMILREIATCDLFVYLCSNESLQSPYCQSELREAVRLQKQILPVIVRPKTNYPYAGIDHGSAIPDDIAVILRDTNCIDLSRGFRDRELGPKAAARLYGAINKALDASSSGQPPPLTPYPTAQPQVNDKKKRSWLNEPRAIIVAAMITGVFALIAVIIPVIINGQNPSQILETPTITVSPPPTMEVVVAATTLPSETPNVMIAPSNTDVPTATSSPSLTPSSSPTPTVTFSPTNSPEVPTPTESWTIEPTATDSPTMSSSPIIETQFAPTPSLTQEIFTLPVSTASASLTPEPCYVRTSRADVAIHVGPGNNRAIRGALPNDVDILVTGQYVDESEQVWWRVQPPEVVTELDRYWVLAIDVDAISICNNVVEAQASGIVPIAIPQPTNAQGVETTGAVTGAGVFIAIDGSDYPHGWNQEVPQQYRTTSITDAAIVAYVSENLRSTDCPGSEWRLVVYNISVVNRLSGTVLSDNNQLTPYVNCNGTDWRITIFRVSFADVWPIIEPYLIN